MRGARAAALLGALAWLVGCASDEPDPQRDVVEFERSVADACGYVLLGDGLNQAHRQALEAGTTRFDPEAAERCLELLDARGCSVSQGGGGLGALAPLLPGACSDVYEGTVERDGSCQHLTECARGLHCQFDQEAFGRCAVNVVLGGPCAHARQCAAEPSQVVDCVTDDADAGWVCEELPASDAGAD